MGIRDLEFSSEAVSIMDSHQEVRVLVWEHLERNIPSDTALTVKDKISESRSRKLVAASERRARGKNEEHALKVHWIRSGDGARKFVHL